MQDNPCDHDSPLRACRALGKLILLWLAVFVSACAPTARPGFDTEAQRSGSLRIAHSANGTAFSARCRLILRSGAGDPLHLDGVIVGRLPDHVRIRAWKFTQPCFDLTSTPRGTWLLASGDADLAIASDPATAKFVATCLSYRGSSDRQPRGAWRVTEMAEHGTMRATRIIEGGAGRIFCDMGGSPTTLRECRLIDANGAEVAVLSLDDYHHCGDAAWPTRLVLRAGSHAMTLLMDEVDSHAELSETAFTPPAGATRIE